MDIIFYIYFILVVLLSSTRRYKRAGILGFIAVCHISMLYAKKTTVVSPFLLIAVIIIFFTFCVYLIRIFNKHLQVESDDINRNLHRQEEQLSVLKDKDGVLIERNVQIEKSLSEIVTIYEYVKKLGSTMEFNEAVGTLEEVLTVLVHFRVGKLVLLEENNINGIYRISGEKKLDRSLEVSSLKEHEKSMVAKMVNSSQTILYEKGKIAMMALGAMPGDIQTLLALPLLVERQLVGVIMLENIPLVDTDKMQFIALQFAMEVKKTQLFRKIKNLSTIDGLTGIYLRRHFGHLLANELDRGYRQGHMLSVMVMDVDYFKRYNDEYGHLVGDLILKEVAGILKDKSREIDILCRYGGDEFVLALPRTNTEEAQIVAERLRRSVNEHLFQVAKEQFQVSLSIGISSCNSKDMRVDGISGKIIESADKALYKAKAEGRNKVVAANCKA